MLLWHSHHHDRAIFHLSFLLSCFLALASPYMVQQSEHLYVFLRLLHTSNRSPSTTHLSCFYQSLFSNANSHIHSDRKIIQQHLQSLKQNAHDVTLLIRAFERDGMYQHSAGGTAIAYGASV